MHVSLSLSQSLRKTSGFTLIELMVVMAIIAILATAGLSAYTGYIKKARDATRIEDLRAINSIVMGSMTSTGMAPDLATLKATILAANNNQPILDPLNTDGSGIAGKYACLQSVTLMKENPESLSYCNYIYQTCDGGIGYRIMSRMESVSNIGLLNEGDYRDVWDGGYTENGFYSIGSCIGLPLPTSGYMRGGDPTTLL